ncbi:MAG: SRPBCC domain-containing protein [Bacteroidales bacterium]|nr:SRPBCC domain-containing protein [Bacteroidales bacterium]
MFSIKLNEKAETTAPVVFNALTDQDALQQWFAPQVIITPTVNTYGAFAFDFDLSFRVQITELKPNRISWEVIEGIEDWKNTVISFDILEVNDQCEIQFEHKYLKNKNKFEQWQKSWSEFLHKLTIYCSQF